MMDNSEKLFLTWNDFEDNQKSSFALLRNDTDLTNVTLAFEDGKQVELHKVVLATSITTVASSWNFRKGTNADIR